MTVRGSAAPPSILLVEDSEDISDLFSYALRAAGYSVVTASCVKEVEALLAQSPVSLVITDWNLSDGTGATVCEKAHQQNRATPIVLVSGQADLRTLQTAQCQIDSWLTKPIDPDKLVLVVRQLLEQASMPETQ
jgi:DNA-binding response OmpR family regulator